MRMVYDGQGQMIEQSDPLGNSSTFVYDGANNLKEQINASMAMSDGVVDLGGDAVRG